MIRSAPGILKASGDAVPLASFGVVLTFKGTFDPACGGMLTLSFLFYALTVIKDPERERKRANVQGEDK